MVKMWNYQYLFQLVHKIQSYLPPSDLLTCTEVSSTWEGEARKHIFKRVPSRPLCCSTVGDYFNRGRPHSKLRLATCDSQNCFILLVAQLKKENAIRNVTSFKSDIHLIRRWGLNFKLGALFPNLSEHDVKTESEEGKLESESACFAYSWMLHHLEEVLSRILQFWKFFNFYKECVL